MSSSKCIDIESIERMRIVRLCKKISSNEYEKYENEEMF